MLRVIGSIGRSNDLALAAVTAPPLPPALAPMPTNWTVATAARRLQVSATPLPPLPPPPSQAAECSAEAALVWKDPYGYGCDIWMGYECIVSFGYSQAEMDDIRLNCPRCCGLPHPSPPPPPISPPSAPPSPPQSPSPPSWPP
eukprot:4120501-Prymnesium_polylepis.1